MNFTGEHGGMIAAAFVGAWAMSTTFWFGVGAFIWKMFLVPRIKSLEDQIAAERAEWKAAMEDERRECNRQLAAQGNRINQLETMLLMHGPQSLRQAMQVSLSEHSLALDAIKDKSE